MASDTTKGESAGDAPNPSSQEVGDDLAVRHGTGGVLRGVEDLEVALQVVVDVQNRGHVAASVAVVRC